MIFIGTYHGESEHSSNQYMLTPGTELVEENSEEDQEPEKQK
jgi:hypothetical protein